ncbi:hypothetical protein [Sedimentibacter sp.]|uniref:hypothetical protein n=1 Tax=Sedimentibacter sp. TaxID=1960295 RepID=UPI0028AE1040|nr:hypothetical protein [Sedimentibacter sp.]
MKNNISMGMGGTLVIVIFVVLCLTVFATLSFTTAYSDLKLVNKTHEMTSDYYTIEGNAEKRLSEIFNVMIEAAHGDLNSYYHRLSDLLSRTEYVTVLNNDKNDFKIYYEVHGNKNQKICVTLRVLNDVTNKPKYEILTWNLANAELPVYEEEYIDLWEGIE